MLSHVVLLNVVLLNVVLLNVVLLNVVLLNHAGCHLRSIACKARDIRQALMHRTAKG